MTFYIFALAAGLAVFCGLIAGSIAGDIQEQLPGITYDPNIPWKPVAWPALFLEQFIGCI